MGKYVLGVDIGSGSMKLTLLSANGRIKAVSSYEYQTYYPKVGWSEQDPEDWCRALYYALQTILGRNCVSAEEIEALAIDAATHTAVLLDEKKEVIRRAILWTDQRSQEEVCTLKDAYGDLIGEQVLNEPTTIWTLPQMMWIRKNEPQVWDKIRYILFAKDYLRFRLTGTMETDRIDAMGSMFYNARKQEWSSELCKIADISSDWLPNLSNPIDTAGRVTKQAAVTFGFMEGTKVFVGTTDTVMEVYAAGSVKPGHTTVKLATAGRICAITDKPLQSPFIFNYRHIIPGLWYPGTATSSCAASYRWYRDNLGMEAYDELNKKAERIPPGSDGVMFHPYLNGELTPYNDPMLRASFIGVGSGHTKAHFTRAVLEGVAFSMRDCMDMAQKLGMKMERVRIIGGGAKGKLWRQITADILGVRMEKMKMDDSSFGTAMMASVGVGWFSDYDEAVRQCAEVECVSEPVRENQKIYTELFYKYKEIQAVLAPIYGRSFSNIKSY